MQQDFATSVSAEALTEVPVSALRIGMYVADLDRPWLETPFLLEGLLITTEAELETLRRHCRRVYVSVERSAQDVKGAASPVPGAFRAPAGFRHPMERELPRARRDYVEAKQLVTRLLSDQQNWHRNMPQVKETIQHFAKSIIANPNALMWLTRIKHKNEYTAEHCLNVGVLAMIFAQHLGYPQARIEELGLAGMLHDVGKMRVDPAILEKPGKLTAQEYQQVKAHVLEGYAMLAEDPTLSDEVKTASRDHHERINGEGYPYGKTGNELGQAAKIIAIIDAYDAITSERVYSEARPPDEALRILYQARNQHFDEALVVSFIECIGIYPPGAIVELNNGMIGIVISKEPGQRLRPRIRILLDEHKTPIAEMTVDLSREELPDDSPLKIRRVLPPGSHGISMETVMRLLL
ncbi:HD-GYP domain-containing protein [Halomonas sp. YLGW01]|uniref:HD-GYP domain-containing protein n=1 Tax=Halomonas sp. YLGW01 TaxID=2773308 RepID=UPI0017827502|nr:HD-GYP domain-containing protein [Halomonas sp. YLGW01]